MGVLHDYKCAEHGYFEAFDAVCPQGCTENVMIVHLQAPGLKSDRTKNADTALDNLATDFKMGDIKSTREGDTQGNYFTRNNAPAPKEPRAGDALMWGDAGRFNLQSVLQGGAARPIHGEQVGFNPQQAGNLTGPKAASYMQDHENLKVDK